MKLATYCRHWQLTRLVCLLHGGCPDPEHCPDYRDAVAIAREYDQVLANPPEPRERPAPRPVPGPECATTLRLCGHDAVCECPEHHTYRVRRSARRSCPQCHERLQTFGVPDPGWDLMYRLVYHLCACGYVKREGRLIGPNPNGPGRYGGQRWSPRTGRLLARKR